MKIIYSDNIPTDTSSETVWLDGIPKAHTKTAERVCGRLNSRLGDQQGPFYKVVEDNHVLYKWKP